LVGTVLAIIYAVGDYLGRDWLVIPRMASTHGVLNGLGFVLLALLGWLAELHTQKTQAYGAASNTDRSHSWTSDREALREPSRATGTQSTGDNCKTLLFPAHEFYDR
jgi:hypothetical protein